MPRREGSRRLPAPGPRPGSCSRTLCGMELSLTSPQEIQPGLGQLIKGLERLQGAPPFGEVLLSAMARPDSKGIGVAAAWNAELVAYAFTVPNPDRRSWTLEVAAGSDRYGPFLAKVLDLLADRGVREAVLWVHSTRLEPPPGLVTPDRHLHRMVADLPMADDPVPADGVVFRGFDPDHDSHALIELNNLAFAGHPEQGGWTFLDLNRRMAQPWFDPSGVRTAWIAARMVAFNWTKLHPEPTPRGDTVGEIYAIAVNPDVQGLGLGRAVAAEGLRHLARRRGATKAMLYVDSSNDAAIRLYRSMGFTTEHTDRSYRWVASP